MDNSDPTVVKVSSPADILGVLPHRLGFHARESLVVVALHGPRRRDELVMRFDLPEACHDDELCREVVGRLRQRGADATVLVCYTEAPGPRFGLTRAPLVRALRRALGRAGITVVDALLVRDGRWWSYLCRDASCCPPEGSALPASPTAAAGLYAAESVARGQVVLADRPALERSIEPVVVDVRAVARATKRLVGALDAGDIEAVRRLVLPAVDHLVAAWLVGDCAIDDDEALVVALGLRAKDVRDEVMTLVLDHDPEMLAGMFTELARRTPDTEAAPVCTVLAWCAYAVGNGALAGVAAERAQRAEPGYALAELILAGLAGMQPPALVREISALVRAELTAKAAS